MATMEERGMRTWLAAIMVAVLAGPAVAGDVPVPLLPGDQKWGGPPQIPALKGAWMLGANGEPGPYVLRVRLAAGGRIPPHTHPDERHSTVLSGTIYVGFGERFDEGMVVAVPAGAVYVAPANVPHYVWARDGNAVYQESGVGPTATAFVAR